MLIISGICFALAIFMPSEEEPAWIGIVVRGIFFLGGTFHVCVAFRCRKPVRPVVILSPIGLEWRIDTRRTAFWQWDEIAGARCVRWVDHADCPHGGVIVQLKPNVPNLCGFRMPELFRIGLQWQIGEPVSGNVIYIEYCYVPDWNAEEVAKWINESANDPAVRERWGDRAQNAD